MSATPRIPPADTSPDFSHEELNAALQAARTAVWEVEGVDGTARFSDSFFMMLGVLPAEGRRAPQFWRERVHPQDLERVEAAFRAHFAGRTERFEEEYRLRHAEGHWLWVLSRAQATYRDPQGGPLRMTGITVDIHERRAVEESLRASEERFRLAAASANGVVYDVDIRTGRVIVHGVEKLAGGQAEPRIQTLADFLAIVHPDDRARLQAAMIANRQAADQYEMTYRALRQDGQVLQFWHRGVYQRNAQGDAVRAIGIIEDVTEQISVRQELSRSEFRLRAVAEMSPGYIFQMTVAEWPPSVAIFASPSFDRLMGCSHDEFLHTGGYDSFCDAESLPRVHRAFDRMRAGLRTDTTVHGHNRLGEELWLRVQSLPVYDSPTGRRSGTIGAVIDITAARRAELALRESQQVLQTLAASSPTQLALFDANGRCVFLNYSLGSRPVQEPLGRPLEELLPPAFAEQGRALFEEVIASGQGCDVGEVFQFSKGPPRRFEIRLRPVHSDGRVVGLVSNVSDVTEYRRAQESLNLHSLIIETMREGVLLLDRAATILLTNPALDEMFGYARGVLVGRSAGELSTLDGESFQAFLQHVLADLDAGAGPAFELEGRRSDGSRLMASCILTDVAIAKERRIIVVINDTTERKQLEHEVLQVAAREQQRIGGDLHDGLGQQLTGIAMLLKGVSRRFGTPSSHGAREQMEQVISLVNDAIETTRSLARGLSPVSGDRNGVIVGLQELANRTQERYKVRVGIDCQLPELVVFDENTATQLYRITQEAVSNAIKHGKARQLTVRLCVEGNQADLAIVDDGAGFDPRRVQPTGTGLKIMHFRAQMAGGILAVDSVPGAGATVRCRCPVRPEISLQ